MFLGIEFPVKSESCDEFCGSSINGRAGCNCVDSLPNGFFPPTVTDGGGGGGVKDVLDLCLTNQK